MPRSNRDDDDDDRPRSRRRRDDDPPPKSGPSVWLILGIVFAVIFLLCGVGVTAVVFGLVLPAAQKVREKQEEIRLDQEKTRQEFENPARQPQNNRLSPNNVAKVRAGFTQAQVEELLGVGSPASAPHVNTVCDAQPNAADASARWLAAHRVGKVYVWQTRDDIVLIAYTHSPNAGGTVNGVLVLMNGIGSEPVPVPPEMKQTPPPDTPDGVVSISAVDLATEFDADVDAATKKYHGKTLRVNGTVTATGGGGIQLGLKGFFVTKPKVRSVHIMGRFEGGNRGAANAVPLRSEAVIVGRFAECKAGNQSHTIYLNDCTVVK